MSTVESFNSWMLISKSSIFSPIKPSYGWCAEQVILTRNQFNLACERDQYVDLYRNPFSQIYVLGQELEIYGKGLVEI